MILLKETGGDTLTGAIDGVNTVYYTSFDFNADSVNVYVNGRLKMRDWDDGFWVTNPNIVTMKEPLQADDSLEVEYKADVRTGGGADGGCPDPPQIEVMEPDMQSEQNIPDMSSDDMEPAVVSGDEHGPSMHFQDLRPRILKPDEDGGC